MKLSSLRVGAAGMAEIEAEIVTNPTHPDDPRA
jgi:hypothetical protein